MALSFPTQTMPPRGARHLLRRMRLIADLRDALNRRAIVITAAAGAGKTSLLLDLVSDLNRPTCWLTLDEWLADPVELLGALAGAAERMSSGAAAAVELALTSGAGEAAAQRRALVAILNALATRPRGVIVIDDLHRIPSDSPAATLVDTLLKHLPAGWCLVLAGRRLPELPQLTVLALDGDVLRLSQDQLALTLQETRSLLEALCEYPVIEAQAERIWRATGGWAAGVVLRAQVQRAAITEGGSTDQAPPSAVGDAELFAYLARAVLDGISLAERHRLLRAAVPRTLDSHTYAAVMRFEPDGPLEADSGDPAPRTPALLAGRHAFIAPDSPAADSSPRFRMHDLFRDFLLTEANRAAPAFVARLHAAIGRLCEQRDDAADALYHYREAGDWPALVRVARQIVARYRAKGRWRSIGELVDGLPAAALRADPELVIDRAEAHCNLGHPERTLAELALLWPRLTSAKARLSRARALVVRGTALRVSGLHAAAVADCREGERLLLQMDAPGSLRAHAQRLLGIALAASGDLAGALAVLKQALQVFETLGVVSERSSTHDAIAATLLQLGRAGEAAPHLERARQGWSSQRNRNALALTLSNLGVAYTILGDLDLAEDVLAEAQRQAEASDNERVAVSTLLARAEVLRERSDGAAMAELGSEALRRARRYEDPYNVQYAIETLAEAHRLLGDLGRAEALAREAAGIAAEQAGRFEQGLAELTLGMVLTDRGDVAAAVERLRGAVLLLGDCNAGRELVRARFALAAALVQATLSNHADEAATLVLDAARQARQLDLEVLLRNLARRWPALIDCALERFPEAEELKGLRERMAAQPVSAAPAAEQESSGTPALPSVRAYLLGRIRVQVNGEEVTAGWESEKARELLFFLLANPGIATAEQLVAALWPDTTADHLGRKSLHTTVYRLRQALYHDCIETSRQGYRLNPHGVFWFDVDEFRRLSDTSAVQGDERRREQLEQAAAVYAGPLAATVLGEWAEDLRRECEERYVRTLSDLATYYLDRRRLVRAIDTAERALALDPFAETVARVLFEARLQGGDMAAALRVYRRFRDVATAEGLPTASAFAERYREVVSGDFASMPI
ncbi:MAG: tetratricopeptide repeat protein [Dehalococcoidia bacterium]